MLLEAVEGTDICERATNIAAIQALCDGRIETRSAEFSGPTRELTPEERLLGEGLGGERVATLESAITRLAENTGDSNDFSNQVIASVALGNPLADSGPVPSEEGAVGELSADTQALVNAIVTQLGGQ